MGGRSLCLCGPIAAAAAAAASASGVGLTSVIDFFFASSAASAVEAASLVDRPRQKTRRPTPTRTTAMAPINIALDGPFGGGGVERDGRDGGEDCLGMRTLCYI